MRVEVIMTPIWENTSPCLSHCIDNVYVLVLNQKVHMRKIKEIMKKTKKLIGGGMLITDLEDMRSLRNNV